MGINRQVGRTEKKMTPRERILTALNREVPDRVPKDALFTPPVLKTFQEKTGANDPEEYFGMELRRIRVRPTRKKVDFTPYLSEFPPGTIIDEWGVGHAPGSLHHFTRGIHPMAAFNG